MIANVLIFDLTIVFICIILLLRSAELTFLHPATVYLFFHLLVVSFRLFALNAGAPTLFMDPVYLNLGFAPASLDEITKAALLADLALGVSTFGFIMAADAFRKKQLQLHSLAKKEVLLLDPSICLPMLRATFVIGIFGFFINSNIPGIETRIIDTIGIGDWQSSSWVSISQSWSGLALLGFIYIYGFRRSLVLLISVYLFLQFYQGYHRFRIMLPIIFLIYVYIRRHDLKWPSRRIVIFLVVCILLFLPAKRIGQLIQNGASIEEIIITATEYLVNLPTNSTSDLVFLDQFAVGLSLINETEKFYYGAGYLPLLTLPIPRQIWPDKPEIAFFMYEIETNSRPIGQLGMILTYLGEAYANFGIVGIIIIPYLLSYGLGRLYHRSISQSFYAVNTFAYMLVASSLIQVYRDGLVAFVLFVVVNSLPITLIILTHIFASRGPYKREFHL